MTRIIIIIQDNSRTMDYAFLVLTIEIFQIVDLF